MDHIEQEGLLIEISFSIQVQGPKLISPPVLHWQLYKHDSVPCFSPLGKWDSVGQNASEEVESNMQNPLPTARLQA